MPYDPTRSGLVTEAVFRRCLRDAFRMPFTEEELTALTERYCKSPDNKVRESICITQRLISRTITMYLHEVRNPYALRNGDRFILEEMLTS